MPASLLLRLLAIAVLALSVNGAQLPLRHYTTADGLANNGVYGIVSDARGFLWFATGEGVSRFDGVGFTNQTARAGGRQPSVRQMIIDRRGSHWLATPDGIIRFQPDLPPSSPDRLVVIRPQGKPGAANILALLEDRSGKLWCGTGAGLYAIEDTASPKARISAVPIGLPGVTWDDSEVTSLAEDPEGGLWIGAANGTLYCRRPDQRVDRIAAIEPPGEFMVTHLMADRQGRIWKGRTNGLFRSMPAPHPGLNGFERLSGTKDGPPAGRVFDIFQSRDGDVWVAMYRCLAQFTADGSIHLWGKANGLPSRGAGALGQDRDGNIWMGTADQGVFKLVAGGILSYSAEDGIGVDGVIAVGETVGGEIYFAGRLESEGFRVGVRKGDGFAAIAPRVSKDVSYFGWRAARVILQDQAGEWWLATSQGLCRYPRLEHPSQLAQTLPKAVYTMRDGLPGNVVVRVYEDRAGNIWVGTETHKFAYWSKREQRFVAVPVVVVPNVAVPNDGLPGFASAFGEDSAGEVWIGDEDGQLWRVRSGKAFAVGGPPFRAAIEDLLLDHAGRLWVATGGHGLLRFDQPTDANPQFRPYGSADGLSSLNLRRLTEDNSGAIYIGTGGGVDRLDPDLTHFRHYTFADGIAQGEVNAAYRDRAGALWFGTNHGLTRLVPTVGTASDPPPVWITGVSIAGRQAPVSDAGESSIRGVEVQPGQEHIQFDFVGLSYSPGNILRYQYRLRDDAWSSPIDWRSVVYGALTPGAYTFAVRSINSDGETSAAPATVEFQVALPLWRRAWFQALLLVVAMGGAVLVHRVRASRLLEIERMRSDIALDLHDDIASNLAQITIFGEIAMREAPAGSPAREPLARIAETARDTVECISDIVWSMRPQKEGDLLQRIRRVGSDALTSRQIGVAFHFSEEARRLTTDPNTRRQVYLIYKEAVHNVVRHSRATAVAISMSVDGRDLVMKVADNGAGMESAEEGNGLPGMRSRAASLKGRLALRSSSGAGTEVELRVPWKKPWRLRTLPV